MDNSVNNLQILVNTRDDTYNFWENFDNTRYDFVIPSKIW